MMTKKIITIIITVVVIVVAYQLVRTYIFPREIKDEAVRAVINDYLKQEMIAEDFGLAANQKTWKVERFAIYKLEKDSIEPDERIAEVTFWGNYETSGDSQIPIPKKFKIIHRFRIKGTEKAC